MSRRPACRIFRLKSEPVKTKDDLNDFHWTRKKDPLFATEASL